MEHRPQSSRLTWLAVALGAGACALLGSIGADARWLAALGRTILTEGSIPTGVPYAASPSVDWVNVPVLGELVFHALQVVGGDRGLLLAQLVAVTAALTLLALGMRAYGAPDAASALALMLVFFATVPSFIIVRAQLFSLVLFCVALLLLRAEARTPSRRVWLLVPLIAIWTNLHGAVLVGLAIAAAYLVLERFRREPVVAASVLAACCAALFITPAFAKSGSYYLGVLKSEAAQRGEGMWAPLSLHKPFDVLFILLAIPLLVFAYRSGLRIWEFVCVAALAAMTLHAGRNAIWLLCFIAAPAAHGLGKRFLRDFTISPRPLVLCAVVPAAFLAIGVFQTPPQDGAGKRLRSEAARLAAGKPILADGIDAEQLALDGRRVWIANPLDAFSRRDQRRYLDWLDAGPAGDELLSEATAVVVTRGSAPQRRLERDRSFRRAALDAKAAVYVRVPSNG
ncbi:MAG TPA: hypothetical protein VF963_10495 [Gaiellaceae bacterium]